MAAETSNKRGKYLYAITRGNGEDHVYGFIGVKDAEVHAICSGKVAAVVSDVPDGKLRPERRSISAHHEVQKLLMKESTVLPVSFGVVAEGAEAVRRIISRNEKALLGQLDRVAGKVEMGLLIKWDVPNIFEHFVKIHPELREARDRVFDGAREPAQADKIELGRIFERLLDEDRDACAERVLGVLGPLCSEVRRNAPRSESEVANMACLVRRAAVGEFEEGVIEAARLFDNNFAFDYNGPWAPYNFVELSLEI